MSVTNLAEKAYARPSSPSRTTRGVEYDLLARVTRELGSAWETRDGNFPKLAQALHDNLRLWSVFASDVSDEDNGLPQKLRGQIYYLYRFTEQHSRKVLKGNATVEVLIDINTAVMRGLRGGGDAR